MREETIPAVREKLDDVLVWTDEQIEPYGCSRRTGVQLHVCVEELFVNICNYAYTPKTGDVHIQLGVREGAEGEPPVFWMTLEDKGIPFDPLEHIDPDITLAAEDRSIGGLGILMVKKRMDSFTYEYKDGCNVSHIEKKLV